MAEVSVQVKLRLRAIFQGLPQLHDLPRNATVFLTFTNGHYSELMLNSLATIAALGLPAFVYCFDKAAVELCEDLGIPHFQPPDAARMMESADFRQDRAKFLEMGVHKPEMVERLFSGASVRLVHLEMYGHAAADVCNAFEAQPFVPWISAWGCTVRACRHCERPRLCGTCQPCSVSATCATSRGARPCLSAALRLSGARSGLTQASARGLQSTAWGRWS